MRTDNDAIGLYHGYLNLLHAYLQGYYTRLNVQSKLLPSEQSGAQMVDAVAALEHIAELYKGLWDGKVIDFKNEGNSEEASFLFALIPAALYFFDNGPSRIAELVLKPVSEASYDELVELTSYFAEQAYSREHFLKGLIQYGDHYNIPEVADRFRQHLLSCQQEINEANSFFALANDKEQLEVKLARLQDEAFLLPGIVMSKGVELRELQGMLNGRFGYVEAGFSEEEVTGWEQRNIPPGMAAAWSAFGFDAVTAHSWMLAGFTAPAWAAGYFLRGFELNEAVEWVNKSVSAQQAARLVKEGVTASEYHLN